MKFKTLYRKHLEVFTPLPESAITGQQELMHGSWDCVWESSKEKRESRSLERVRVEAEGPEPAEKGMVEGVWKEHLVNRAKCQQNVAICVGGWRHWPWTGVGMHHPLRWRDKKKMATDKRVIWVEYTMERDCRMKAILLDEVGDEVIWSVQVGALAPEILGLSGEGDGE